MRAAFEQAGFDVVCASNGVGGLRRAIELKPRLIVLGGPLPEMSAGELAVELRTIHHFSSMQIVTIEKVLSGNLPDEAPAEAAMVARRAPSRRRSAVGVAQHAHDAATRYGVSRSVAALATAASVET